jgi:hypothetical protein
MTLIIHLICALSSIIITSLTVFRPSKRKLNLSSASVAATLATGTYLVVSTHSNLLSSCMSGLFYLAVTGAGIAAARYRLVHVTND